MDTGPLVGHLAAWNYFHVGRYGGERGIHLHVERAFIGDDARVTNDPMEAHYIGFQHVGAGGREGRHDGC